MSNSNHAAAHGFTVKAAQPATPLNFVMPADACDCHTHIHGAVETFPYFAARLYTPGPALPDEMAALHQALGIRRVVIVTPSVYGTDNAATLYGMRARGADARGVAVLGEQVSARELDLMHAAGIRGMRINLHTGGTSDPRLARERFNAAAQRMQARGWHIQIFTTLDMVVALQDDIAASPVPVVLDHFGGAQAAGGVQQAGFEVLLSLLGCGHVYVKISGAYRCSTRAPDYADCTPLAQALFKANADRIVWGSDWPHPHSAVQDATRPAPFYAIDDGRLLNQLADWAPDAVLRQKILVDNPARLYDF